MKRPTSLAALALVALAGPSPLITLAPGAPPAQGTVQADLDVLEAELAAWTLERLAGREDGEALAELRQRAHGALLRGDLGDGGPALIAQFEAEWIDHLARAGAPAPLERAMMSLSAALADAGGATPSPLSTARALAAETPDVKARLASWRADQEDVDGPGATARATSIDRAVREAMAAGDGEMVRQLGSRAVPTLEAMVRADPLARGAGSAGTPLWMLLSIDGAAGLDLALELVSTNDLLIKRAVADELVRLGMFRVPRKGVWKEREDDGSVLVEPEWIGIVDAMLEDPAVSETLQGELLTQLASSGALPAHLYEPAKRLVRADFVTQGRWGMAPSMRGFFEVLVGAERRELREVAVTYFSRSLDPSPVWALAKSGDPRLTVSIARALGTVITDPIDGPPGSRRAGSRLTRSLAVDERYVDVVRDLVETGDARTIEAALWSAYNQHEGGADALPQELLVDIARRSRSDKVDAALIDYVTRLDEETQRAVTGSLARTVEGFGGSERGALAIHRMARTLSTPAVMELLATLQSRGVLEGEALAAMALGLRSALSENPTLILPLLGWVRSEATTDQREALFRQAINQRNSSVNFRMREATAEERRDVARALARFEELDIDALPELFLKLDGPALEGLILDDEATLSARATALDLLPRRDHSVTAPEAVAEVAALVIAETRAGVDLHGLERRGVPQVSVLERLLDDARVTTDTVADVDIWDLRDEELIARLQDRFPVASNPTSPRRQNFMSDLAASSARFEGKRHTAFLLDAVTAPGLILPVAAVNAVRGAGAVRRPEVLRAYVEAKHSRMEYDRGTSSVDRAQDSWTAALSSLATSMTDDVARYLIACSSNPAWGPKARALAQEQLEAMVRLREAAARWERGAGADLGRTKAVRGLVELIEGDGSSVDARVQAIRGLGLLGAAEELPRLIVLMESANAAIAAAAREAIDAIHAGSARATKER